MEFLCILLSDFLRIPSLLLQILYQYLSVQFLKILSLLNARKAAKEGKTELANKLKI